VGLAATSGVHSGSDALKALLVGADVVMVASTVLRNGADHVRTVQDQMVAWMTEREYESVNQLRGSASAATVANPTAFERANYVATLHSWSAPDDLVTA
jgi:dihydroorotate dehydrogenase (fumarate)